MEKMTSNEQKVHGIVKNEIINDGGMGCELSTITDEMNESAKVVRGYIGSMVKKGIIEIDEGCKIDDRPDLYYIKGFEL